MWLTTSDSDYILYGASTKEEKKVQCRSLDSLFRLVGNPGIVWHPASNQCVHTQPYQRPVESEMLDPAGEYIGIFHVFVVN